MASKYIPGNLGEQANHVNARLNTHSVSFWSGYTSKTELRKELEKPVKSVTTREALKKRGDLVGDAVPSSEQA
jgi:hypothetical protein